MTRGSHLLISKVRGQRSRSPIDFQGQGSKVKVTRYTVLLKFVNTIQTEPFQLGPSNLIHILLMTRRIHLLISKVKKGSKVTYYTFVVKPWTQGKTLLYCQLRRYFPLKSTCRAYFATFALFLFKKSKLIVPISWVTEFSPLSDVEMLSFCIKTYGVKIIGIKFNLCARAKKMKKGTFLKLHCMCVKSITFRGLRPGPIGGLKVTPNPLHESASTSKALWLYMPG